MPDGRNMERICVFCGSGTGARPSYAEAAKNVGKALAQHKISLVYGGGNVGLMGIIADVVSAEKGEVIGVIPEALVEKELAHSGVADLRIVQSMHERKSLMADLSDGFIALPGGFGTLEEFCEILTWAQLGFHDKPCGLLNVEGYFDPLLAFFDHQVREGFVTTQNRALALEAKDPMILLELMARAQLPASNPWLTGGQR